MFTQCSKCETVFKLSAEVLRAAGGQVRCGKCGEVFNALAHLAEDPAVFTVTETDLDLEARADSILESPAPPAARSASPSEPREDPVVPGIEIARLQILDWNEGELPGAAPTPSAAKPAAIAEQDAADGDGDGDGEDEDEAGAEIGETSLEFTLPPGELDRIFVESKKGVRQPPPQALGEDIEVFDASGLNVASVPPTPTPTAPSTSARAVPTSATPPPAGFEVPEAVRQEMLSGIDAPDDSEGILEPKRRVRRSTRRASPFDLAPAESSRSRPQWLTAAIVLGVLLLAQLVHHNRDWLAAHTPLGAPLRAIYSMTGTPVAPPANLSAYQLRQWGVTGDPAGAGTLRVRASILNTAAQLEPYPLLRVTLANRFGGSIGTRDFEPSEYLGKPTAKLLAPGERVDATLDILDPGKSAEGFEIDVCLRGAERRVACANDKAPAQAKR